ncbi:MAG: hypothetical protein ACRDSS_15835 [Actinocrinis sp.]
MVAQVGGSGVLERLVGLAGADLNTLLLEVMRRRAARLGPAQVMRRYRDDRFVGPSPVSFAGLREARERLVGALPSSFSVVTLAPVAPFGAHSVVGTVNQNNVVTTVRGNEVAADPTNGLALEAAVRRSALSGAAGVAAVVRLAAVQRVVRAQAFAGDGRYAHFELLGVVTAGRDVGNLEFERLHLVEHLSLHARALRAPSISSVSIVLTVLDPQFSAVAEHARAVLGSAPSTEVVLDPAREGGRAYYSGLCFKVHAVIDGEQVEISDGGFTDWTRRLLGNRKERLLISGAGVDRLAGVLAGAPA